MRTLIRVGLVLCTLSWWVLPGMGLIDLSVTWDPEWPVVLEAGWGLVFTVGVGLPFLVAAVRPQLARVALVQLYVMTAALLVGAVLGREPETWWIFLALALELPLLHALALPARRARAGLAEDGLAEAGLAEAGLAGTGLARDQSERARPHLPLLALAAVAAPAGGAYLWRMAALNQMPLFATDITNSVNHYSVQGALGVALVALPAIASLWPATRRLLGTSTALMAAYLGLVSFAWPDAEGGFSARWSVAVMVWSAAVLVATWWPGRLDAAPRRVSSGSAASVAEGRGSR